MNKRRGGRRGEGMWGGSKRGRKEEEVENLQSHMRGKWGQGSRSKATASKTAE